jgi:2-succinyl-6-hydroxy-2,4-cyclohexadiene-1-carboxylate synthase
MACYLPKLTSLQNHILLITGEEDEKYCKMAQSVKNQYPHANWEVIENASHNTHLEQPQQFVEILTQFMN